MKQYDYFLLDWDGNLAKTLDIWLDAIRIVLKNRGIHKNDSELGESIGLFVQYMKDWGVIDPETALEEADHIAKKKLPEVELYPDALTVLDELKKRSKSIALITTSPHENVGHLLIKHDIERYFDAIVGGDDTTLHKPHPEPLEMALELLSGTKERAIMIGDSDKDILAAKNFGIDSGLFFPAEHEKFYDYKKLKSLNPTFTFENFCRVLDFAN